MGFLISVCLTVKILPEGAYLTILTLFRVVTISPTDTVLMATKKMLELRLSSAVVTVENKPRGILTSVSLFNSASLHF